MFGCFPVSVGGWLFHSPDLSFPLRECPLLSGVLPASPVIEVHKGHCAGFAEHESFYSVRHPHKSVIMLRENVL